MPRPKATEPRTEQVLLRLTAQQREVLEAVAHLERSSPNAYAHQVVVQHLAAMLAHPRVQADLANRCAYDADAAAATPIGHGPTGARSGSKPATARRSSS